MRILLVEDDQDLLTVLSSVLESDGHQVVQAESAHAALLTFSEFEFDLVILDFKMPRTDGLRVAETIKLQRPAQVVLLMSAYATPETVEKARSLGVEICLDKPFRLSQLRQAIAQVFGKEQGEPEVEEAEPAG